MDDQLFLSWAAGFFDGEGCVLVSERKSAAKYASSFQLYATVTQQDPTALYALKSRFGGNVTPDKTAAKGYNRKCGSFLCWRWKTTSIDAFSFLQAIEPYSIVKKEQIQIALKWPDPGKQYRGTYNAIPDDIRASREAVMYALRAVRQRHKIAVGA
jgi:hypothetical protein